MKNEIQKTVGRQLAISTPHEHSAKLMRCIAALEISDQHVEAKLALTERISDLAPGGRPDLLGVVKYPMIRSLIAEYGKSTLQKVVFLLIKDFCNSVNVVRNMNEDQMIECSATMIDECGNFRLEDYAMFFALAKRGRYGRILDRIDIQTIMTMFDEYADQRWLAGKKAQEDEVNNLDTLGPTDRRDDDKNPEDMKLVRGLENLNGMIGALKQKFQKSGNEK